MKASSYKTIATFALTLAIALHGFVSDAAAQQCGAGSLVRGQIVRYGVGADEPNFYQENTNKYSLSYNICRFDFHAEGGTCQIENAQVTLEKDAFSPKPELQEDEMSREKELCHLVLQAMMENRPVEIRVATKTHKQVIDDKGKTQQTTSKELSKLFLLATGE